LFSAQNPDFKQLRPEEAWGVASLPAGYTEHVIPYTHFLKAQGSNLGPDTVYLD
jgi:hypothetical protein